LANVSSKAFKAALAVRSNQGRTNTTTTVTPPGYRYFYNHGHIKNCGFLNGVLTNPCKHMAARPQQHNSAKLRKRKHARHALGGAGTSNRCVLPHLPTFPLLL
jgi:hypothetical protein